MWLTFFSISHVGSVVSHVCYLVGYDMNPAVTIICYLKCHCYIAAKCCDFTFTLTSSSNVSVALNDLLCVCAVKNLLTC